MPLPIADGSGAVQAQNDDHLLVRLEVARVVEEERTPGLRLGGVALIAEQCSRAVGVAVQRRRRLTRHSGQRPGLGLRYRHVADRRKHDRSRQLAYPATLMHHLAISCHVIDFGACEVVAELWDPISRQGCSAGGAHDQF